MADAYGWVPDQYLSGLYDQSLIPQNILDTFGIPESRLNQGTPPQYILDAIGPSFTWDPNKYTWDGRYISDRTTGGRWDYQDVMDPALGTYVVLPGGTTRTAESGGTEIENTILPGGGPAYYFEPGQGPTFFGNPGGGNQFFFSNDPAAIDEYQHDARTRQLQGAASVAALVGGAAALGGVGGSGATAAGTPTYTGATTAAGLPTGAAAAAGGGAGTLVGAVPAVGATPGLVAGTGAAISTAAGATGGAATAGGVMNNLPNIISGAATLLGGKLASDAAGDAVDAQVAAGDRALDFQRESRDLALDIARPQLQASQVALARMLSMTGQPIPTALQEALTESGVTDIGEFDITNDPSYRFRLNESMKALETGAFARGGGMSGGFEQKALRYAQDYASTEYSNIYGRLATVAGYGPVASNTSSNAALNYGANAATTAMDTGDARASGYVAQSNAWQNALDQIAKLPWDQWFKRQQPAVAGG